MLARLCQGRALAAGAMGRLTGRLVHSAGSNGSSGAGHPPGWSQAARTRLTTYRQKQLRKAAPLPNMDHRVFEAQKEAETAKPAGGGSEAVLKRRLFFNLFSYLPGYETAIRVSNVPEHLVATSKLFIRGSKALFRDMKEFVKIHNVLAATRDWERACATLTHRELDLYDTLPNAMMRVGPVIILSALPLAQYVIFPLALMYPKKLLSEHFWTDVQKNENAQEQLKIRHTYYRALFRDLERTTRINLQNKPYYQTMKNVLKTLSTTGTQQNSDLHPSAEEILELRPVFESKGVLHLSQINSLHVRHLMLVHGRRDWMQWRRKLQEYANLLRQLDLALLRDTQNKLDLKGLDLDVLEDAARRRGLSIEGLSRRDMEQYLDKWLRVSQQLNANSNSLLLHLPVLLGYNHQNRHWDNNVLQ